MNVFLCPSFMRFCFSKAFFFVCALRPGLHVLELLPKSASFIGVKKGGVVSDKNAERAGRGNARRRRFLPRGTI